MVLGNRQAFLVAIIVLNDSGWKGFAADKKLDPHHPNCRESKTAVLTRITSLLTAFPRFAQIRAVHLTRKPWTIEAGLLTPRFAQIRAVHLTRKPWTIEAGLLTPTLKIKRDAISTLFAKEIDALYREH
jgi:long-chain acyl-CoA synthetase